MKLFVTRHGLTDWNLANKVCGISQAVLLDKGIEQAKNLAKILELAKDENNIKHLFVSPLQRAIDTISYTEKALGIKAVIDNRLSEINFGTFEGVDWKDPEFTALRYCPYQRFPEGESMFDVAHRAYSFLDELKERVGDENTLILAHGYFDRTLATYFKSFTFESYLENVWDNCELKIFNL